MRASSDPRAPSTAAEHSVHAGRYVDVRRRLRLARSGVVAPELDAEAVHLLDEEIGDAGQAGGGRSLKLFCQSTGSHSCTRELSDWPPCSR